jgi:hypothetical protein
VKNRSALGDNGATIFIPKGYCPGSYPGMQFRITTSKLKRLRGVAYAFPKSRWDIVFSILFYLRVVAVRQPWGMLLQAASGLFYFFVRNSGHFWQ